LAVNAATEWEIRSSGDNDNGGGFNASTGMTDYTQQDAAQLSLTDLACLAADPLELTSVTGGFTAAMVGNLIHITAGTNFVVGFYEVVAYSDGNTVTLDRTPISGGDGSVGVGKLGGALATLNGLDNKHVAGNTIWVKVGVTLPGDVTISVSGAGSTVITFEGYETTRGDTPVLDDRPLIACGGNYINNSGYRNIWRHLRISGSKAYATTVSGRYYGTLHIVLVDSTASQG